MTAATGARLQALACLGGMGWAGWIALASHPGGRDSPEAAVMVAATCMLALLTVAWGAWLATCLDWRAACGRDPWPLRKPGGGGT